MQLSFFTLPSGEEKCFPMPSVKWLSVKCEHLGYGVLSLGIIFRTVPFWDTSGMVVHYVLSRSTVPLLKVEHVSFEPYPGVFEIIRQPGLALNDWIRTPSVRL